jgi:hypothetical protein
MSYLVDLSLTFTPMADCSQAERDARFPKSLAISWIGMWFAEARKDIHKPLPEKDVLAVNAFASTDWSDHGSFHEGEAAVFVSTKGAATEWTFKSPSTGKTIHVGVYCKQVP